MIKEIKVITEENPFAQAVNATLDAGKIFQETIVTRCPNCHLSVRVAVPIRVSEHDLQVYKTIMETTQQFLDKYNIPMMMVEELVKNIRASMKKKIRRIK